MKFPENKKTVLVVAVASCLALIAGSLFVAKKAQEVVNTIKDICVQH